MLDFLQIVVFFWIAYLLTCVLGNLFNIHPYGWTRTYVCAFGAMILALIV